MGRELLSKRMIFAFGLNPSFLTVFSAAAWLSTKSGVDLFSGNHFLFAYNNIKSSSTICVDKNCP